MTNPLYFPNNVDTTTDFINVVNKNDVVVSTSELLNETTAGNGYGGLVGLSTNYIKAEKNKTDKKRICFKILKVRINDIYKYKNNYNDQSQQYSYELGIDLPVIFLQDV